MDTGNIPGTSVPCFTHVTFPKLQEYAEKLGKTNSGSHRGDEKDEMTKMSKTSSSAASFKNEKQEQKQQQNPFNLSTYESEIVSKSGRVFSPAEVRRILQFHLKAEDQFWVSRIHSVSTLCSSIDSMAVQVPEGWQPAAPQKVLIQFISDPDCPLCRGVGSKRVPKPNGNGFVDAPCDCPKQKQILNRKTRAWENVN